MGKGKMRAIGLLFSAIGKLIFVAILLAIGSTILFVAYKGNQPMQVPGAPKGMTYFEFMGEHLDSVSIFEPSWCGWGLILPLATIGPIYSVVYTEVGIHPEGILAKSVAPDPDIPKGVAGADWPEIPGIWWNTVERLSWTMLGKQSSDNCQSNSENF